MDSKAGTVMIGGNDMRRASVTCRPVNCTWWSVDGQLDAFANAIRFALGRVSPDSLVYLSIVLNPPEVDGISGDPWLEAKYIRPTAGPLPVDHMQVVDMLRVCVRTGVSVADYPAMITDGLSPFVATHALVEEGRAAMYGAAAILVADPRLGRCTADYETARSSLRDVAFSVNQRRKQALQSVRSPGTWR